MCRFGRRGRRDPQQPDRVAKPACGYRYAHCDVYAHIDLYFTPAYSHPDAHDHANCHSNHHARPARRLTDPDIITNAVPDTSDVYGNATTAADESSSITCCTTADFNEHINTRTNS